jgi:hypothetical protein
MATPSGFSAIDCHREATEFEQRLARIKNGNDDELRHRLARGSLFVASIQ